MKIKTAIINISYSLYIYIIHLEVKIKHNHYLHEYLVFSNACQDIWQVILSHQRCFRHDILISKWDLNILSCGQIYGADHLQEHHNCEYDDDQTGHFGTVWSGDEVRLSFIDHFEWCAKVSVPYLVLLWFLHHGPTTFFSCWIQTREICQHVCRRFNEFYYLVDKLY